MDFTPPSDRRRGAHGRDGHPRGDSLDDLFQPAITQTVGERFACAIYRTSRLILQAKGLLDPGKSLAEAVEASVGGQDPLLDPRACEQGTMPDNAVAGDTGDVPTLVAPDMAPENLAALRRLHLAVAHAIGYDEFDDCLFWLQTSERCAEFMPTTDELLALENMLLLRVGPHLVDHTRHGAFEVLSEYLGEPSRYERKDWAALPMAFVRDFEALSIDDDRALMVARLEALSRQAIEAMDLSKALAAQRAIAQVQSLTFQDDTKGSKALAAIFSVAAERSMDHAVGRTSEITKRLAGG